MNRQTRARLVVALSSCLALFLMNSQGAIGQEAVVRQILAPLEETEPQTLPVTPAEGDPIGSFIEQRAEPTGNGVLDLTPDAPEETKVQQQRALRIGLIAENGPEYLLQRTEPFRSYLADTLNKPVEIIPFSDMRALMAAHIGQKVDYSIYPASIFAMAYASCGCLEPIAAPVSAQAPDGTYMLLVVRASSGIKSLADMMGRTLALSSKNGAVPFYMAMNELKKAGLNPERDLASLIGSDTPQQALGLLDEEKADGALVWSTTQYNQSIFSSEGAVSQYLATKKGSRNSAPESADFLSIWHSPAIPAGPHAIHSSMSKQDRADLINALKEMNKRDPEAYDAIEREYGAGLKTVSLKDYEPLIEIATAK